MIGTRTLQGFSDNPFASRGDAADAVRALVAPMVSLIRRDGAALDFGDGAARYGRQATAMEGVSRPLWGLAPLAAGGGRFDDWPVMRAALAEGTDLASPKTWGVIGDIDQRAVEMAAIGFTLAIAPKEGWDAFSPTERDRIATWLSSIQKVQVSPNNWLFFTVLVQEGLRAVGRTDLVDEALQRQHLDRLSAWYLGEGWYGDGGSGAVDHYGGFAMHYYGLAYAWLRRAAPDDYSALFRERANAFAEPFSHWFADSGEAVVFGRSMTYRFAMAAFWGMLGVSGERPLPAGVIRGLWARHLRSWGNKPIFAPDGLLTRGVDYPNLHVCEDYNAPPSPYWALKSFIPLALPETDEFWTAAEEPLPPRRPIYPMPSAKSVVQRVAGHAVLHTAAPIHRWVQADKYGKFAYSTRTGIEVGSLDQAHLGLFGDNILAFSFDDGDTWQMRIVNEAVTVDDRGLTVRWHAGHQFVETRVTLHDQGVFTRQHCFTLTEPALVAETGFAVNCWHREGSSTPVEDPLTVAVSGENGLSAIRSLDGALTRRLVCRRTNTNTASPRTLVPGLTARLEPGTHFVENAFLLAPDGSAAALIDLQNVARSMP